jgi:preprotein translocase subunit YajC
MPATSLAIVLAETGDAASGSVLGAVLPLVLFGAIMYFLIIRPQRKRQREQQDLQEALAVGADVVTIGGIHGTIEELGDDWADLVVDADGTVLRFQRQAIARTVSADVPAGAEVELEDED